MTPPAVRATALAVPHGFFGREGGVSVGDYASLNCGLGSPDDPAAVRENRARARAAVAAEAALVGPYQTHSAICLTVTAPWPDDARPEADALVTATRGLALSILTADCAPVLLADARARVVGAAHAGWKGAVGGVIAAAVAAMRALGAKDISAAIGPCIAQAGYEVGPDMQAAFAPADRRFFAPGRGDRWQFDLAGFVASRLAAAGVAQVDRLDLDTLSQPARYFSYRRSTLAGEPGYGRQISIIALP